MAIRVRGFEAVEHQLQFSTEAGRLLDSLLGDSPLVFGFLAILHSLQPAWARRCGLDNPSFFRLRRIDFIDSVRDPQFRQLRDVSSRKVLELLLRKS
jgi:hypothetical protein